MSLRTKIEPINRDIELMLSESLSPQAKSATLAEFAGAQIEDAKETDRRILGRIPRYTVSVDGRDGASLGSVKPDGVVIAEFELFNDVLAWIADQLEKVSPFKSGRYRKNNTLFADGIETDVGSVLPDAAEFVFINTTPYARKIERGASSQAPDGVFQVVATLAQRRFGNIAKITFTYRTAVAGAFVGGREGNKSDQRNPAILVKVTG